jgi:hypothetical protein
MAKPRHPALLFCMAVTLAKRQLRILPWYE